MEMFLMALCLSMFGLAVAALAFGAATRGEAGDAEAEQPARPAPAVTMALGATRFFGPETGRGEPRPQVPLEVLLLQIERHVRLEQAAAESFIQDPSLESLHSRTMSPLVH